MCLCALVGLLATVLLVPSDATTAEKDHARQAVEVIEVRGVSSEALDLVADSDSVTVVDVSQERERAGDLAAILNRVEGVQVARFGGLGSAERVNLAGLTGARVPLFVDGIPIVLHGFGDRLSNLPVGLISAAEIYRGVTPIRFGADTLGGAINLVTRDPQGSMAAAAIQGGSFSLFRSSALGQYQVVPGFALRIEGFFDRAVNNYPIEVDVDRPDGSILLQEIDRFHDGYRSGALAASALFSERSWADAFQIRLGTSGSNRDIQHDLFMVEPFGESREAVSSAFLRISHSLSRDVWSWRGDFAASRRQQRVVDEALTVYSWLGTPVADRQSPGEIFGQATDADLNDERIRGQGTWTLDLERAGVLALTSTYDDTRRDGDNALSVSPQDPFAAELTVQKWVSGGSHRCVRDAFENQMFVKLYTQRAEQSRHAIDVSEGTQRLGGGNGIAVSVAPGIVAKASYEYATRLPEVQELFGDGIFTRSNIDLEPERSHNINLEAEVSADNGWGSWGGRVLAFARRSNGLIAFVGQNRNASSFQNLVRATSQGLEGSLSWAAPNPWLNLAANATWIDSRNRSEAGTFAQFDGDRIPNQPWLFGNVRARLDLDEVLVRWDGLSVGGDVRLQRRFFRSWESVGSPDFKQTVDDQLALDTFITYSFSFGDNGRSSLTVEVLNVTDAPLFDTAGVQRPGRAWQLRWSVEFL